MPFKIATATASFRAPELSEDRLAVHKVPGCVVLIVADGAGGMPGGGRAADMAITVVEAALSQPGFNPFLPGSWTDLLVEADAAIARDRVAGETTCVVLAVTDEGRVVGASSGDSGAVVVRDGTTDDLTEKQKRKLRLGSGRASPVTFEREALTGILLAATDGLFNYARPDVIARIVTESEDLDEVAEGLVEAVRLAGGDLMDDVALVLVRV